VRNYWVTGYRKSSLVTIHGHVTVIGSMHKVLCFILRPLIMRPLKPRRNLYRGSLKWLVTSNHKYLQIMNILKSIYLQESGQLHKSPLCSTVCNTMHTDVAKIMSTKKWIEGPTLYCVFDFGDSTVH